jgi:hypothetical protein
MQEEKCTIGINMKQQGIVSHPKANKPDHNIVSHGEERRAL